MLTTLTGWSFEMELKKLLEACSELSLICAILFYILYFCVIHFIFMSKIAKNFNHICHEKVLLHFLLTVGHGRIFRCHKLSSLEELSVVQLYASRPAAGNGG